LAKKLPPGLAAVIIDITLYRDYVGILDYILLKEESAVSPL
jgi:hypothetical protein